MEDSDVNQMILKLEIFTYYIKKSVELKVEYNIMDAVNVIKDVCIEELQENEKLEKENKELKARQLSVIDML